MKMRPPLSEAVPKVLFVVKHSVCFLLKCHKLKKKADPSPIKSFGDRLRIVQG
jgi:hypothetical protein